MRGFVSCAASTASLLLPSEAWWAEFDPGIALVSPEVALFSAPGIVCRDLAPISLSVGFMSKRTVG
jgi:hypothetical protein